MKAKPLARGGTRLASLFRRHPWVSALATGLALSIARPVYSAPAVAGELTEPGTVWILTALLGFLMPIGVLLVSWGGVEPDQTSSAASAGLLALFLAIVGYSGSGFALQYGGIGWSHALPGLEGLSSPFVSAEQATAGLFGTRGFFMQGEASGPGPTYLFLAHLPWVMTAVLIPTGALQRHAPGWVRVVVGLATGALAYPLVANWSWAGGPTAVTAEAGGWMGNTGVNHHWGHGVVDFGGAGTVHLLGGAMALAGILLWGRRSTRRGPPVMPPPHLPMLSVLGMFVWLVGWSAAVLAHPLYAGGGIPWGAAILNAVTGMAAGAAVCQTYAWFVSGQANALMAARGGAAGLVAISAAAPFIPLWAALAVGAVVGLAVPFVQYVLEETLRYRDPAGAVPVSLFAGLAGLLVVGLLSSGHYGAGWNSVGAASYLAVIGQGVTGLLPAAGFHPDPSQFNAQLFGAGVILAAGVIGGGLVLWLARLATRPWAGRTSRDEEE